MIRKAKENHVKAYFEIHQDRIIKVELISAFCLHILYFKSMNILYKALFYTIRSIALISHFVCIIMHNIHSHGTSISGANVLPASGWYWSASEGNQAEHQ